MKKWGFIVLVFAVSIYLFGCGKKQQSLEEMQEPMSIEALSSVGTDSSQATAEVRAPEAKAQEMATTSTSEPKLETMPPSGPYKPTTLEIQTALKNAGFYTGNVDGKKGPKTKKAIEDFQKAKGLAADGKVGPKTWIILGAYLSAPAEVKTKKR